MKLLKENYGGLEEFAELPSYLKMLLAKPEIQKALKNSDFETLYRETWKRTSYSAIGEVTQLLINLNINPLDHLSFIPIGFLTNTSIKHLDIPDHITSIDEFAFAHCSSLTSITIPNSVTSIGNSAFGYCSKLNDIKYIGTKDQWSKIKLADEWGENSPIKTIHCIDGDITL